MRVTYMTEDPARPYALSVSRAKSVSELRKILRGWSPIADDALAVAMEMSDEDWPEFRRGLESERKKTFAGEEWAERFMPILLPERMLAASSVADQFKAPWGLAYLRCQEIGWKKVLGTKVEST